MKGDSAVVALMCAIAFFLVCALSSARLAGPLLGARPLAPPECPDVAIQRGGVFEIYDSSDLDRAPLVFVDTDQYEAYLRRQRLGGRRCPRVVLRRERDISGRAHFREDAPHTRGIPNYPEEHIDFGGIDRAFRPEAFAPEGERAPPVPPATEITFNHLHRFVPAAQAPPPSPPADAGPGAEEAEGAPPGPG